MREDYTTIAISRKNRDRMAKYGILTERFDEVLEKILDYYDSRMEK